MKKSLLLISLLLLAACHSTTPAPTPETTDTSDTTEHTEATTLSYTDAIQAAPKTITANPEFHACIVPYIDACVQQTGYSMALAAKNTDICHELSTGDQQDACRLGVIMATAHEHQDVAACDVLESEVNKRTCQEAMHRNIAMSQRNIDACQSIAGLYSDEEKAIGDMSQEQCMLDVILSGNHTDVAQCDVLTTENIKTHCQESIRMHAEMQRLETPSSESSAQ